MKTGINLLAWLNDSGVCKKTIVNKDSFPKAIAFARDDYSWDVRIPPEESGFGFVRNEDIQHLIEVCCCLRSRNIFSKSVSLHLIDLCLLTRNLESMFNSEIEFQECLIYKITLKKK